MAFFFLSSSFAWAVSSARIYAAGTPVISFNVLGFSQPCVIYNSL